MKAVKIILKLAAALAVLAGALALAVVYLDKLRELYDRRDELKIKAVELKDKAKDKGIELKQKLPTREDVLGKLPTKDELIRRNPFRKAEIEAEFSDYADVD